MTPTDTYPKHTHPTTEDAATDNDPPPKPIPVISADWTEPTPACRRAVDAAVRLQQKGDVGFFELWPEAGPLGNPLQKRTGKEGRLLWRGMRVYMRFERRTRLAFIHRSTTVGRHPPSHPPRC